jgi:hypothetical protein
VPRRSAPTTTVAAVLAALTLAALLNGPGLVTAATGLEVGTTRTVAMRAATVIADTGALLRLDGPRRWLTEQRNRGLVLLGSEAPSDASAPPAAASQDPSVTAPDPAEPQDDADGQGTPVAAGVSDANLAPAGAAPVLDHDRTRRPITAEQPLEVLFVGDSLIGNVADGFGRVTDGRDTLRWSKDVRISTGLARPDVLDWPRHLEQQLAVHDPDVVVLMLGGNDDQSLTGAPDGVLHLGEDGWEAEYERRVGELLSIAQGDDRLVVWLGLPAMRPDKLERTRPLLRAAAERAVAGTEVVLLDTAPIVSPAGYTPRLDGVQVRADDGVHLSHSGGDRVAAALDRLLQERYDLPAG